MCKTHTRFPFYLCILTEILFWCLQCLMPTKQQLNMWFLLRYLSSNAWPLQRYNIWEYTFSSNTFVAKSFLCSPWHIRSSQMKSKMFYLWFWRFSSAVPFYIKEKLCQTTKILQSSSCSSHAMFYQSQKRNCLCLKECKKYNIRLNVIAHPYSYIQETRRTFLYSGCRATCCKS